MFCKTKLYNVTKLISNESETVDSGSLNDEEKKQKQKKQQQKKNIWNTPSHNLHVTNGT